MRRVGPSFCHIVSGATGSDKDAQRANDGEYYSERDTRTPVWLCAR